LVTISLAVGSPPVNDTIANVVAINKNRNGLFHLVMGNRVNK